MKYWMLLLVVLCSFNTTSKDRLVKQADRNEESSKIQIALLLDTSNSMDGLIEQAKGKLWSIVNEFARYEKGGVAPVLEIGLFEYGNDGLSARESWIRQISAFTTDLDFISEQLFNLRTYGGSEYCGAVIHEANQHLEWSRYNDDLKLIFIAGNESFDQGHFSYRDACNESKGKGIAINTIYCGGYEQGIRELWKEGASCGSGKYINIDQNKEVTYIETPYDKELDQLNKALNDTYIYYGSQGSVKKENQSRQDNNARSFSGANAADRAVSKASGYYKNTEWDLVDAYEEGEESLDEVTIRDSELPTKLKGKTKAEIERYVANQSDKREEIKADILEINKKRRAYIATQQGESGNTLDQAILRSVEDLAKQKGFRAK